MTIVDKFSIALNQGFRKLCQPSEVAGDAENGYSCSVSYFSIARNAQGGVDVAKNYGFEIVRENELRAHKAGAKRHKDAATLDMLDRVETVFSELRSGEISVDDMNARLHDETESFYQRYIAGEAITQTYAPMARNFIPDKPDNPEDEFMHRRALQQMDERIGTESEIPHERIRQTWGLEVE